MDLPAGNARRVQQEITLNLSKQHFPRYLDYLWISGDGKPKPITLKIDSVKVYLNPKGMMPHRVDIQINNTPESEIELTELLYFDSVPGLSSTEITNESGTQLTLTVSSGQVRPEEWKDMYVLLQYQIATKSGR